MTRPDGHAPYVELAAGHALGALEPEDEQVFLAHLPSCAACERDLARHLDTAAQLAHAADPVDPPPSLLANIRSALAGQEQHNVPAVVLPLRRRRTGRLRADARTAWTAAAAALVLVLALGGWNVVLHQRSADSDQLANAVSALDGAPGRSVPLVDPASRRVAVVAVLSGTRISLVLDGLPANDARRTTYVLWAERRDGQVSAVRAFDARGGVQVLRDLPLGAPASEVAVLAVTRESGRTAPVRSTRAPVAAGSVRSA